MPASFLLERFAAAPDKTALVTPAGRCTYGRLLAEVERVRANLHAQLPAGTVVLLEADYSPAAVAHLLALIQMRCIVVPLTNAADNRKREICQIAQVQAILRPGADAADVTTLSVDSPDPHPLYTQLRSAAHPGLVLFSSGSSGKEKGIVHDCTRLLTKYRTPRHDLVTLAFLLFDHIGGLDTLLYCLSNTSTIVVAGDRSPQSVCGAIAEHRVEVLPVSPTFLNMMLLSQAHVGRDLSSLRYITYGTEVMPDVTLKRCTEVFPNVTFLQKYGATELGTLRSKSRSSDSTWVKIGGDGYQVRVVDGALQIKADSSMIGYLNAPSPFTEDGWFMTGDAVETDGDYVRILGRKSDIINVGGQKVYPAQVENVIQELSQVSEVVVFGQRNPILGNIVCARITPATAAPDENELIVTVKSHCQKRLEPYQVPVRVTLADAPLHGARFKKLNPATSHAT